MKLTVETVDQPELLLLKTIAGSRAYGTDTPDSDTDYRGVFIMPKSIFFGLNPTAQVSDATNDETYYEIGRFIELLAKNNPNILELLYIEEECLIHRDPILDLIDLDRVLSKQCEATFGGYAITQIRKARGLNKKIVKPMDGERKSILEFCYTVSGQGSVPIREWLEDRGMDQKNCGLVNIPHMRDVYGIYYSEDEKLTYRGMIRDTTSTEVILSSIPAGEKPVGWMTFNKDGFKKYCKDYREYHDWVKNRNEARYANNVAHGKNYDSKNLMHTFRLLDMAEEIAREGTIKVRRPNREFLMKIRAGEFEYDDLIKRAEEKVEAIREAFEQSSLRENPDREKLEQALIEIREARYGAA